LAQFKPFGANFSKIRDFVWEYSELWNSLSRYLLHVAIWIFANTQIKVHYIFFDSFENLKMKFKNYWRHTYSSITIYQSMSVEIGSHLTRNATTSWPRTRQTPYPGECYWKE
jgi:hypothetical protein